MIKRLGFATAILLAAICGFLSFGESDASAAGVLICYQQTSGLNCIPVSAANPLPVSATVSASVTGFQPSASGARGTPVTVTTSDSSGNLPTGAVVLVSNPGANLMYCNVNGVAATTSDEPITSGGGWFAFTIPSGVTVLRCIATGGSTTANMVGGSGLPTGTGGGGGSGGVVTNAGTFAVQLTGATNNINNIAGTVSLPTGAATAANQATNNATTAHTCSTGGTSEIGCLGQIDDDIKGAIPAGTNLIGKVGIDQTTQGSTNAVSVPGAIYNTIAASQSAQILSATQGGGTGATGDYLSHCVVFPTTTSAGTVTIADNSTQVGLFTTGTLSNLVPFTIPIGAKSVSGAWKVTTGAAETVACFGKFSELELLRKAA